VDWVFGWLAGEKGEKANFREKKKKKRGKTGERLTFFGAFFFVPFFFFGWVVCGLVEREETILLIVL